MLRDDGIVFDDGTTTRLSENRFFMTTSTAKAADVLSRLEFLLDTAWPELRVAVTSVSDEWAAMSVAGPKSRDILAAAFPGLDVSSEALPHMGCIEAGFEGRALRILRLSYSGERAYEVYVGAIAGETAWTRLLQAGAPFGAKPYGVEALGALRVEKGHVAGPEIDGRTTLDDLGLGRITGKRAGFVGDVLRRRPAFQALDRQRLVGLECVEAGKRLRGGAILFALGRQDRGPWPRPGDLDHLQPGTRPLCWTGASCRRCRGRRQRSRRRLSDEGRNRARPHRLARIPRSEGRAAQWLTWRRQRISACPRPIARLSRSRAGTARWSGSSSSLSQALGTTLPALVGETVRHADTLIVRVAPRRFWLISDGASQAPSPAVDPELGCSVALSEGRVRFTMTGARVPKILSACVAVDWLSPATAPGRALHASFHHVPVLFIRTGAADCDLIVPRSFAKSLSDWIAEIAG